MELLPLYAAVFSTVSSTTSEVSYCALHLQRINLKPTFRAVTATNITGEAAPSVLLTPHEDLRPTHRLVAASGGHK